MAADSAATLGQMGQQTVIQSTTKKLNVLLDKIIVAVSGPVGLSQRLAGEVDRLWREKAFRDLKPFQVMTRLREEFWKHVGLEYRIAAEVSRVIGPAAAAQDAICSVLVALPVERQAVLFQFDQQCSPEEVTSQLPFASIGSGQQIADPFLAFLRRIFWKDTEPNLNDGLFAAVWTVEHAIKASPGGVAGPIQVATIERSGSDWEVHEYLEEELGEHKQAAAAAETRLAEFKAELQEPIQPTEIPPAPSK